MIACEQALGSFWGKKTKGLFTGYRKRPPFSFSPSHRAPRSLFFFLPSFPTTQRGLCEGERYKTIGMEEICIPFINDVFSLLDTDKEEINTCIYKGARFEKEYILDTRTYFKPTETFQYTHPVIHTRSKKAS